MLDVEIDEAKGIALLKPAGPLTAEDFESASRVIDPLLDTEPGLRGFIISTETFPGWDSLEGLFRHIRFIMDHHARVGKVALVTDSILGQFAPAAKLLVDAQIVVFSYGDLQQARDWISPGQ